MKMEYERYSERYRRNETNGNVGIISEDSEVIRRRTMLQEQQREELRTKKLKKRKESRNKMKAEVAPAQKEKTTGKGIVLLVYLCCHAGIDRGIGAERDFL